MLELIPENIDYQGIDISPTQIEYARKVIKKMEEKNASVSIDDILDLKIKDTSFESALLCDVIEHVLDPQNYLMK